MEWELMNYDFSLTERSDVEISLGFATSSSVGAANNTLLYIDNVRLLKKNTNIEDGIANIQSPTEREAYSTHGIRLQVSQEGGPGIYIVDGKKVVRP